MSPAVAASWHPAKNGDSSPTELAQFSNSIRWWQSDAGHEWPSTVKPRGNPGYVYFLEHRPLRAFKVGITNVGTNRLDHFRSDGSKVLHLELVDDGAHALAVEGAIKHWWRVDLCLPMWLGSEDMVRTSGWTETAHSDELTASGCIAQIQAYAAQVRALGTSEASMRTELYI